MVHTQVGFTPRTGRIGSWCRLHPDESIGLTRLSLRLKPREGKDPDMLKLSVKIVLGRFVFFSRPLNRFSALIGPVKGEYLVVLQPEEPVVLEGCDAGCCAILLDGRDRSVKPDEILDLAVIDVETDRDGELGADCTEAPVVVQ